MTPDQLHMICHTSVHELVPGSAPVGKYSKISKIYIEKAVNHILGIMKGPQQEALVSNAQVPHRKDQWYKTWCVRPTDWEWSKKWSRFGNTNPSNVCCSFLIDNTYFLTVCSKKSNQKFWIWEIFGPSKLTIGLIPSPVTEVHCRDCGSDYKQLDDDDPVTLFHVIMKLQYRPQWVLSKKLVLVIWGVMES